VNSLIDNKRIKEQKTGWIKHVLVLGYVIFLYIVCFIYLLILLWCFISMSYSPSTTEQFSWWIYVLMRKLGIRKSFFVGNLNTSLFLIYFLFFWFLWCIPFLFCFIFAVIIVLGLSLFLDLLHLSGWRQH
jgi:hypothetical protein